MELIILFIAKYSFSELFDLITMPQFFNIILLSPTSVDTTGVPQLIASKITLGKPSLDEDRTNILDL